MSRTREKPMPKLRHEELTLEYVHERSFRIMQAGYAQPRWLSAEQAVTQVREWLEKEQRR